MPSSEVSFVGSYSRWIRTGCCAVLAVSFAGTGRAGAPDRAVLVEGVRSIGAPGVPGPLSIVGPGAFAVVAGRSRGELQSAVVAAGTLGDGRVVAFGHTDYLGAETLRTADTGRLVQNAVRWAAGRAPDDDAPVRVAAVRAGGLAQYLQGRGFDVEQWAIDRIAEGPLPCDVLALNSHDLRTEAARAAAERFVADGGGLIVTGLGWGWLQLNPGRALAEHPGNLLLREAGIAWADGTLARTAERGYSTAGDAWPLLHAGAALDALEAHEQGDAPLPRNQLAQAGATVIDSVRAFPAAANPVADRLRRLAPALGSRAVPTPAEPLRAGMALPRAVLTAQWIEAERQPPEQVQAHLAAEFFPGSVPDDAPRVTQAVEVDTRIWGWHSTGLYAAPGEVVTVTASPEAAAAGLRVQIGCHTDRLWHLDTWRRLPEIVVRRPLEAPVTRAANPVGGLVYIDVPARAGEHRFEVTIGGAVEAPRFELGITSVEQWRETIRHQPAPWAELATDRVIVTVPSRVVRALDDPEPVLHVWNDIADACADLAARPHRRDRPERYVADEQISAGYMHAGYPIMTHLDAAVPMTNRERLLAGQWGLFHEMGHNHQSRDWTFEGTGEVTVNLFSLYIVETVCKLDGPGHPAVLVGPRRNAAYRRYVAAGRDFNTWKADPFLALTMYLQLREAFGWEAYKQVFAEYRDLPPGERPRTDAEKRDQWLVRFSRTVGRNLGPFFEAWGVPTSAAARADIADLPDWWPEGFPRD